MLESHIPSSSFYLFVPRIFINWTRAWFFFDSSWQTCSPHRFTHGSCGKQTAVDFCCVSPTRFPSRSLFFSGRTMDRPASRFCRVIIVFSFFPPSRGDDMIKTIRILFHLRACSLIFSKSGFSLIKKRKKKRLNVNSNSRILQW